MKLNTLSSARTVRRPDAEAPIHLTQRRAWFTEGDDKQDAADKSGATGGANGKTLIESLPPDIQEYIRSLRSEAETARKTLKEKLEAVTAGQQKQLEEQGNFKTLADQRAAELEALKPYKERSETLENVIRSSNAERIKTIPDNKKSLVAVLVDVLPPEKLQQYLNENASLFVNEPAPKTDAGVGVGGGSGTAKLSADELETAKRMGMTSEEYAKAKAKLPPK